MQYSLFKAVCLYLVILCLNNKIKLLLLNFILFQARKARANETAETAPRPRKAY